jgi:uncharacterized membrane protein
MPNCLKKAETNVILIVFIDVLYHVSTYTLPFLTIALHESTTRKDIFWSVTIYNNKISSQCNLTAQIEQVQDYCS